MNAYILNSLEKMIQKWFFIKWLSHVEIEEVIVSIIFFKRKKTNERKKNHQTNNFNKIALHPKSAQAQIKDVL